MQYFVRYVMKTFGNKVKIFSWEQTFGLAINFEKFHALDNILNPLCGLYFEWNWRYSQSGWNDERIWKVTVKMVNIST